MLQISENIKIIRKLYGLTQLQFAELTSVTLAMQKSYEGGKAKPDFVYLERLSELSDTEVADLMKKKISFDFLKQKVEKVKNDYLIKKAANNKNSGIKADSNLGQLTDKKEFINTQNPEPDMNNCEKAFLENEFLRTRVSDLERTIQDKEEIIVLQRQLLGNYSSKALTA